jgi:hypothetical protein
MMAKKKGAANTSEKNFLVQHVEKIGLALAILLAGLFVWSGVSIEKLPSSKSPDRLKDKSLKVATFINSPSWEGVDGLGTQRTAPDDYVDRVEKLRKPIVSQNYDNLMPFDPPTVSQTTHRSDPNLYAALDLRVFSITAPLAFKKSDGLEDPTANDKPAVIKKKVVKKKPKKNNQDGFGGFGEQELDGAMEDMGSGAEMMSGKGSGTIRQLSPEKMIGFRPGTNKILESGTVLPVRGGVAAGTGGEGMMGMQGGGGEGTEMMSAQMGSEGGDDGGNMMNQNVTSASSTSVPATIVAVVGIVPFRKQWNEYNRVLQGASGYEASRDQPRYVYLRGERADVTDDPQRAINDDEWTLITQHNQYRLLTRKWDGGPRELVDEKYLDPFITFVCPPIMMRDISQMLTHPEIPLRNAPVSTELDPDQQRSDKPEDAPVDGPGRFELPTTGATGNSTASASGGEAGGGMMGGTGGGMMGGMGGGSIMPRRNIPEYKLVRFYDFTAKPGRVYRYRVRLLMEDPNHPNTRNGNYAIHEAPPLRCCDDDVKARIKQMEDPTHNRFFRATDWSQPTATIQIADPTQVFAGMVSYQAMSRDQQQRAYLDKEPIGTVKPVVWDPIRGVDIPFDFTVYRGSVLNKTMDVEYAHPVSTVINALEAFDFTTNLMVGDIRGGEELPGSVRDWRVLTPGEFAFIDAKGGLIIHNELDDLDMFDRYDFEPAEDVEEDSDTSMESMMGGEGGMAEMMEGNGGGPGGR